VDLRPGFVFSCLEIESIELPSSQVKFNIMKIPTYSLVISLIASTTLAQEYVAPQNNTPAYSLAARNPLDRRAIDYCGGISYPLLHPPPRYFHQH
jgi:hypothetical protein